MQWERKFNEAQSFINLLRITYIIHNITTWNVGERTYMHIYYKNMYKLINCILISRIHNAQLYPRSLGLVYIPMCQFVLIHFDWTKRLAISSFAFASGCSFRLIETEWENFWWCALRCDLKPNYTYNGKARRKKNLFVKLITRQSRRHIIVHLHDNGIYTWRRQWRQSGLMRIAKRNYLINWKRSCWRRWWWWWWWIMKLWHNLCSPAEPRSDLYIYVMYEEDEECACTWQKTNEAMT
jgi:hypothetical protein